MTKEEMAAKGIIDTVAREQQQFPLMVCFVACYHRAVYAVAHGVPECDVMPALLAHFAVAVLPYVDKEPFATLKECEREIAGEIAAWFNDNPGQDDCNFGSVAMQSAWYALHSLLHNAEDTCVIVPWMG